MSFYFTVSTIQDLTLHELLEALPYPDVGIAPVMEYDLQAAFQGSIKLYLPHRSTRGVSLERHPDGYAIGINVGASPDDLQLALTTVAQLAALTQATIFPEDQEAPLQHVDFCQQYGNHWITEQALHGLTVIRKMIKEQNSTLILNGCLIPFHMGPEFLPQLVYDEPDEQAFAKRLWEAIQRLQHIALERDEVQVPELRQVGDTPGETWTCIAVRPQRTQLLLQTDYVVFMLPKEAVKIDFERVQLYAAEQDWERLDEVHYLLPALSNEDFELLVTTLHDFTETGEPSSDN